MSILTRRAVNLGKRMSSRIFSYNDDKACFQELSDPMVYLQKFLISTIQEEKEFVFLRTLVTKTTQLESAKPSMCSFHTSDNSLHVKADSGQDRVFAFQAFSKIELKTLESFRYISITLNNDHNPIILHGPQEITELWYDALRQLQNETPSTPSSNAKIELFRKAVDYGSMKMRTDVEIPPPPTNYNFVTK